MVLHNTKFYWNSEIKDVPKLLGM